MDSVQIRLLGLVTQNNDLTARGETLTQIVGKEWKGIKKCEISVINSLL